MCVHNAPTPCHARAFIISICNAAAGGS
jgi:hypothetical protein